MILRVLWPSSFDTSDLQTTCLLLGVKLHSKLQSQEVITVVVVWCCSAELFQPLAELQHQLERSQITVPGTNFTAQLAVLGSWQPSQLCGSNYVEFESLLRKPEQLWLAAHGKHNLHHSVRAENVRWQGAGLQAPKLDLQQSVLPVSTSHIQMFVYSVPAQQPEFANVQLPESVPLPPVPWVSKQPGVLSLSEIMRMLQQAHATMHLYHQQPQQQHQLRCSLPDPMEVHRQQQSVKRRRRAQQGQQQLRQHKQQQQQLDLQAAPVQGPYAGWELLAEMRQAATTGTHQRSWFSFQQHKSFWDTGLAKAAQRLAARNSAASAAAEPANHFPHQNPSSQTSAAVRLDQAGVLPVFVQHLLGMLVALNLLLHSQPVLAAAEGVAAWLYEDVLQPHIQWLMQAQPGGVKLHIELSLVLGTAAGAYLQAAAAFYCWAWAWLGPSALAVQAAGSGLGGASWGCAAAADVLLVLLWPLVLLYLACAKLHRVQLWCLSATWRLIRGRQKVRRFRTHHRTQQQQQQGTSHAVHTPSTPGPDPPPAGASINGEAPDPDDEVSVEQLIVGVLLFTPLLGLLPTSTAWYLSVCWMYGALHCVRLLLVAVGSWMQLRPVHMLAARWRKPQLFPGHLVVLPLTDSSHSYSTQVVQAGRSSTSDMQVPERSPKCQAVCNATVHWYRVFYEPLGYWKVLKCSIAQQQGLLWHVAQGTSGGYHTDNLSRLLRWTQDVAFGRVWGLRLLSSQRCPL